MARADARLGAVLDPRLSRAHDARLVRSARTGAQRHLLRRPSAADAAAPRHHGSCPRRSVRVDPAAERDAPGRRVPAAAAGDDRAACGYRCGRVHVVSTRRRGDDRVVEGPVDGGCAPARDRADHFAAPRRAPDRPCARRHRDRRSLQCARGDIRDRRHAVRVARGFGRDLAEAPDSL